MTALVDSDVLVALIDGQEAQSADCKAALDGAMKGAYDAAITPLIAANVMYALRRKWRTTRPSSWQHDISSIMTRMLPTMRMIPVDERDFLASFASEFKDKEDGIQYFAALRSRQVDMIISCNARDYLQTELPVLLP